MLQDHVATFGKREQRLGVAVAADNDRHALVDGDWCVRQFVVETAVWYMGGTNASFHPGNGYA